MERCPHCGQDLAPQDETCPGCGRTLVETDLARLGDGTLPATLGPVPDETPLTPGQILGGRYEILDVRGRGGMGWVYRARDREIDRIVALKVIRKDLARDENVIRRFREEIILARKVTHKHVLRIYDIAEAEGIKFISMPFIEGTDLKTLITERGALPIDQATVIARQIAQALACAHEAGVIHRDLKPQNILLDREGTAYVTDFGIAKSAEGGGVTVTGQIMGTPEYMSPEQAEGLNVDFRTDIYSFGLVLYEMLTGQVAFKADTIISTLMKRLREPAQPPSRINPAVPPWLDNLVMKALERRAEDRYESIDRMLADIESRAARRRRKLGRRTLGIAVGVGVVAVAAAVFLVLRPAVVLQKPRIYLAVLPFENKTGESALDWLATGIPENLTADLGQSKYFRIMSPERLREVTREMGGDLAHVTTPDGMGDLAKATGLDAFALGSVVKAGDKIRIVMRVVSARNLEGIGTRDVEGSEGDLLAMIDDLGRGAKQIFRLSQKDIAADLDRELASQRTRSVKAAADFAKGLESSYQGSFQDAAREFDAAVAADPDFAIAYARAAEAYGKLGYDEKAEQLSFAAVDRVVKFPDRVLAADRAFIMAQHAAITHNTDQAIASYRDYVSANPDDPEGHYNLGLAYVSVSDWNPARAEFARAAELDPKFGSARFELGKVLINLDQLDPALAELEGALSTYKAIGNRAGEALVLNAIGVVYKRKNEFGKATTYYEESIKLNEALGDKRAMAASLGNLGLVYEILGDRDKALAAFEQSLDLRRQIGDKAGISNALNKIGQIYQSDGKFEEALANYERSYEIRKEAGSKDYMASSLSDMGNIYAMMGRYDKAAEMDSLALVLRTEIGDTRDQAQSLTNIAETLVSRGRLRKARARLDEAAGLALQVGDARLIARSRQAMASYYLFTGKADSAVVSLAAAQEAQETVDDKPSSAVTKNLAGEAGLLKGEYKDALNEFDRALALAGESGERELVANALIGQARAFIHLGDARGADSVMATLGSYDQAKLSYETRCQLGEVRAERSYVTGDLAGTTEACAQVITTAGTEDVRCRAKAGLVSAEAELALGRTEQAHARLEAITADCAKYGIHDLQAQALRLTAEVLAKTGSASKAVGLSDQALGIVTRLGVVDVDYLLSCGNVRVAAGDREAAAGYYRRALDELAATLDARCPRRLRQVYISHKQVPQYIASLEGLPAGPPGASDARAYRAKFGLK